MKTLNVQQGTQEWHAARAKHFTASDAPAMMGVSKYKTRDQLLYEKVTGDIPEVTADKQALFDRGHAAEAAARPIAEAIIEDELFPATVTDDDGWLLASLDGRAMIESVVWEHKLWNEKLAEAVRNKDLPPEYYWQLEHQLLVTGDDQALFMVSDGTEDKCESMWYAPVPGRAEALIAGWKQFDEDRVNYQLSETKPKVAGEAVTDLPAVQVQVSGEIAIQDNFDVFEDALRDFLDHQLIREPKSDQDFADLDLQIKALKKAEEALNHAEQSILGQVETIDHAKRRKDMLHKLARDNRLMAEKLFEAEKKNRRAAIIQGGKDALAEHIKAINASLDGVHLPPIDADFAGAAKGKRTLDTIQAAVNDELARAKIAASEKEQTIRTNLQTLIEHAPDHRFLFSDLQDIVTKAPEDFAGLVELRKTRHEQQEQERLEAERARIRQEEAERAEREARERAEREAAERAAQEQKDAPAEKTPESDPDTRPAASREEPKPKPAPSPSLSGSSPSQFEATSSANTVHLRHRPTDTSYNLTPREASMLREALDQAIRKAVDAA